MKINTISIMNGHEIEISPLISEQYLATLRSRAVEAVDYYNGMCYSNKKDGE